MWLRRGDTLGADSFDRVVYTCNLSAQKTKSMAGCRPACVKMTAQNNPGKWNEKTEEGMLVTEVEGMLVTEETTE